MKLFELILDEQNNHENHPTIIQRSTINQYEICKTNQNYLKPNVTTESVCNDNDNKSNNNHRGIRSTTNTSSSRNQRSINILVSGIHFIILILIMFNAVVISSSSSSSFPVEDEESLARTKRSNNLHRHHHQHHPHYLDLKNQQQQHQAPSSSSSSSSSFPSFTRFPSTSTVTMNHRNMNNNSRTSGGTGSSAIAYSASLQTKQQQQQQHHRFINHHRYPETDSWHSTIPSSSSMKKPQRSQPLRYHHHQQQQPNSNSNNLNNNNVDDDDDNGNNQNNNNRNHRNHPPTCPEGPPSQWSNQMDVASKALLSPMVFHGQLISLAEDYGGRIGATFRLLNIIKPNNIVHHTSSSSSSQNYHTNNYSNNNNYRHADADNPDPDDLSILLPNKDLETHIKLYFVRNQNETSEPPFCALYMPDIWQRLKTKEHYLLFAHQRIVQKMFTPPTYVANTNTRSVPSNYGHPHHHHHNHYQRGNDLKPRLNQPPSAQQQQQQHYQSTIVQMIKLQLVSLVTYAEPEIYSRNTTSRLIRKVLCRGCAKPAVALASRELLEIQARNNLTLSCRVDGNPIPWIEWYRNGKRLRNRRRVTIRTRRRVSHLTITRASVKRDSGAYECRAMNVVSKEPSVRRFRVTVTKPFGSNRFKGSRKHHQQHHHHRGSKVNNNQSAGKANGPSDYNNIYPMNESNGNIQDFPFRACPVKNYCVNGGICSYYYQIGEYVCECPDGFQGKRCEYKDPEKSVHE